MGKYEYAGRSRESVRARQKQSDSKYDKYFDCSIPWFKPKVGENCIRIVPWIHPKDPEFEKYIEAWTDHWGITITLHWGVGPHNSAYLCLNKMKNQPCPVCDVYNLEGLKDIQPVDRVLCWLIDRNSERTGLQPWAMPLSVSKDISIASEEKGTGNLLEIDHWDDGYDVFFDVEGEKDRRQYKRVSLARDPSYLAEDEKEQDKLLDAAFARRLPDMLKFYDADYLDKVLSGQKEPGEGSRDDRGGREGEATSDRRRRPDDDSGRDSGEAPARSGRSRESEPDRGRDRGRDNGAGQERQERRARRGDDAPAAETSRRSDDSGTGGGQSRVSRRGEGVERDRAAESDNEAAEAAADASSRRGGDTSERDQAKERLSRVGTREGRERRR